MKKVLNFKILIVFAVLAVIAATCGLCTIVFDKQVMVLENDNPNFWYKFPSELDVNENLDNYENIDLVHEFSGEFTYIYVKINDNVRYDSEEDGVKGLPINVGLADYGNALKTKVSFYFISNTKDNRRFNFSPSIFTSVEGDTLYIDIWDTEYKYYYGGEAIKCDLLIKMF